MSAFQTRRAYLPMDADGDPLGQALADQCQPAPAEASTEMGAESDHPRMPRRRLTVVGWAWLAYLSVMAFALTAAAFVALR